MSLDRKDEIEKIELPTLYKPLTSITIPIKLAADIVYPFKSSKRKMPANKSMIPSNKPPGSLRDVINVQTPFAEERIARIRTGLLRIRANPTDTSKHPNINRNT